MKAIDLTGQRYGRLVIMAEAERYYLPSGNPVRRWLCRCDCGREAVIHGAALRSGNSKSCGCAHSITRIAQLTTHGKTGSKVYRAFNNMHDRCYLRTRDDFADYGGRGITVCHRWHVFENFFADMGDPPPGHSLDRINNNGDYEPGNCRWATNVQQSNNRRKRRWAVRPQEDRERQA